MYEVVTALFSNAAAGVITLKTTATGMYFSKSFCTEV